VTNEEIMAMPQKVFIAMPCSEHARYTDFWLSFNNVLTPPHTIRQGLMGIYIAALQNDLARMFLATDCEWFWLVNDDQLYPRDALIQLLQRNVDVVTPVCLEKKAPHFPLIYDESDAPGFYKRRTLKKGEQGLVPIAAAGGGGTLIHRRVLEAIPDPWWEVHTVKSDTGKLEQTSEDFDFAKKVKDAGFQMYADLDVSVVHQAIFGLRAVLDEGSGEWRTSLMRAPFEQIIIPAADVADVAEVGQ
jgi:hypothetical protein